MCEPFIFLEMLAKLKKTEELLTKKNPKNPRIFYLEFKIRKPYLGVNDPSISVFKSFFIYKILVHPK